MVGSIHFEITEEGARVQTNLSHTRDSDKLYIMCLLKRSLKISKEEFEFVNLLIESDLDKLLVSEQDTTEMSIPSEVLEMLNKMKGDNNNES